MASALPAAGRPPALNRYTYVLNNPLRYTDPTGHAYEQGHGGGIGTYYVRESAKRLYGLIMNQWLFEKLPETVAFGIYEPATRDVHATVFRDVQEAWAKAGYPVPFTYDDPYQIDERSKVVDVKYLLKGMKVFMKEHLYRAPGALAGLGGDTPGGEFNPVGGTLGSFDRATIEQDPQFQGALKITIHNKWDWASASRIPSTDHYVFESRDRGEPWQPFTGVEWLQFPFPYGGTCYQKFYWRVPYWSGSRLDVSPY